VLDNITLRLFLQLDNRLFADLTQDDLYKKHITQEKKKEWKRYLIKIYSSDILKITL
jgi:hypothetical protein